MRYLYAIIVLMVLAVGWQAWSYRQTWDFLETQSAAQAYGAAPDKAKVTILAFMNYTSRPSKDLNGTVMATVLAQPDTRIIFHMLPFSSETTYRYSQIAQAAAMQGKFIDMHTELMRHEGPLSDDEIRTIAARIKLDPVRLLKDAESDVVRARLVREMEAARAMKIQMSPLFMLNRKILFGPDSYETFQNQLTQMIQKARSL